MEVSVLPELDVVPEWQLTGAKGNDGGRSRPDGAGDRGEPCDGKLVLVTAHERLVVTMERQHPGREAIQERRGVSSGAPGAETGGTQRLEQGTDIVLCRYGKARTRRCKFLLKPTGAISSPTSGYPWLLVRQSLSYRWVHGCSKWSCVSFTPRRSRHSGVKSSVVGGQLYGPKANGCGLCTVNPTHSFCRSGGVWPVWYVSCLRLL